MVEQDIEKKIPYADIYRKLQEKLDKLPIGFPATKSGSDLKLLTHFFTPEEAKIASYLKWDLQSVDQIYETINELNLTQKELENKLDVLAKKGSIRFVYEFKISASNLCCQVKTLLLIYDYRSMVPVLIETFKNQAPSRSGQLNLKILRVFSKKIFLLSSSGSPKDLITSG